MNQPPDDDFYNSSTENTSFSSQQRPGQVPGYPPYPQGTPGNYPPPANFPPRGPMSQPGMGPGPQGFPPQGPMSQPGFGPQNAPQGPMSQPGFGPQNYAPGSFDQARQRGLDYPSPGGPVSQPGFSSGRPQQDQPPMRPAPWSGSGPQNGAPVPPWQQQPNAPAFQQPAGAPPWQQQSATPPWQQQPNAPAFQQPTPPPAKRKKPNLWLVIGLVALAIVVIGAGTYELFSHKGSSSANTPTAQGTSTTNGVTPVVTKTIGTTPTTGGLHGIGTPVQAGSDWIATITGVKETTASLIPPSAGSTYLEITLSLKNISGHSLTLVSVLEFTLADGSKHRYNETAADTNIHHPPDGTVNSNQTLDAQIAYQVPQNQHSFILTFAYGLSDNNGASIAWQFTA